MHPSRTFLLPVVALPLVAGAAPALAAGTTELASVSSSGAQADRDSHTPSVSADGRLVAFASDAGNLVPGDTNLKYDIFVRDRQAGTTERVSVSTRGAQSRMSCYTPAISADGRFVTFMSRAANLVPHEDSNGFEDVFVHDRQAGTTERVSVSSSGAQGNGESGEFSALAISRDGRFVAFRSEATNLVPGDTNGVSDVFVRDRKTGTTERVSVSSSGKQGNGDSGRFGLGLSDDGRYVAFASDATNLVAGDTNRHTDIFVHDRKTGTTERVSIATDGAQGNGDSGPIFAGVLLSGLGISADGRYVAFTSDASNLVPGDTNRHADVFVHDRKTGATERVSVGPGGAQVDGDSGTLGVAISADGRSVAFSSTAAKLVAGDTNRFADVFVHDRKTGTTERVSVGTDGAQGNARSAAPAISADGSVVAFESHASNLVPNDTNRFADVFARVR